MKSRPGVSFLVWTTTPWTLPGNAALAVGAEIEYVQVEGPLEDGSDTEQLILAEKLLTKVLKNADSYTNGQALQGQGPGRESVIIRCIPSCPLRKIMPMSWRAILSALMTARALCISPRLTAPMIWKSATQHDLPIFRTVVEDGCFVEQATEFRGMWFKDADKEIIRDLRDRGLMYRVEEYEHTYPHNWRDDTPLMYYARETWFIRATDYKDKMVALNQTINWVPDHIKDGRFGNWLDDLKDWSLGRERYWGTPLPVWVDDETGDMVSVGSVAELSELAGRDLSEMDLHRPYVDDITFPNPNGNGGTMRRTPEVIDVWFDSGAMPLAQWGYPHAIRRFLRTSSQRIISARLLIRHVAGSIHCTRSVRCCLRKCRSRMSSAWV